MYEEVSVFSYITRNILEKSITLLIKIDNIYVGFFTIDSDNDLFITYEENKEYNKELVYDIIKSHILNEIIDGYSKYITVRVNSYTNISPDAYRNIKQFVKNYGINYAPFNDKSVDELDFTTIYFVH